jgi:uncharacterized FlaG/YvyC family protein
MYAIRAAGTVGAGILGDTKLGATERPNGQTSSQDRSSRSDQMNSNTVQPRISNFIFQIIDSEEVKLEFEIDHDGTKISVKAINKVSEEVILEIPVTPEIKMDLLKGVICRTIA